ncbi:hypothetical protein AMATHDRAFT_2699 [Amanita thiersii Skay4041]|uniref:Uncharacterized protein n=1 Tax=Amanita thiersii Skay4041 TaxID=703135 RepID=A0A2A9NVH9_9AGAR|nr:hypothetical protein AMATHDRAFT_2699 [Amanita thiersii Skay4041]
MLARQDPIPDVSPVAALPAKAHGSERAKLACKSCRRDNKKVTVSVMTRDHVRDASRAPKNASMWDATPSRSNYVAKDVGKMANVAKRLGRVAFALNLGGNA